MSYTIDKKYYEGRTFAPIIEGKGPGTVESPGGGTGEMICIAVALKDGDSVNINSNINPATQTPEYAHGLNCITSVTKTQGDFSHNAREGLGGSLGIVVGSSVRGKLTLEPGMWYVSVAPSDRSAVPGMRVTVSVM